MGIVFTIGQTLRILLTEAFNRLEGKTTSASGTFPLSQSMGGGKTHNLITLGLLAKYPKYREQVMADFFKPGDLGAVTVVAFSGRKTSTPFGIWGEIAEQLNRKAVFNEFYSPPETARSQQVGGTSPGGTGAHSPG
jgi:hypothetical protein